MASYDEQLLASAPAATREEKQVLHWHAMVCLHLPRLCRLRHDRDHGHHRGRGARDLRDAHGVHAPEA